MYNAKFIIIFNLGGFVFYFSVVATANPFSHTHQKSRNHPRNCLLTFRPNPLPSHVCFTFSNVSRICPFSPSLPPSSSFKLLLSRFWTTTWPFYWPRLINSSLCVGFLQQKFIGFLFAFKKNKIRQTGSLTWTTRSCIVCHIYFPSPA